jgi:hypothetical protein
MVGDGITDFEAKAPGGADAFIGWVFGCWDQQQVLGSQTQCQTVVAQVMALQSGGHVQLD